MTETDRPGSLHVEFGRLAAARRIMAAPASTGSLVQDRANAERWIARFGSAPAGSGEPMGPAAGAGDGVTVERGDRSLVVRPAAEDPDGPRVMYVHGGGMVYYSTAVFEPFLRTLATELRSPIEAFDYLKAPEHPVEESLEELAGRITERVAALPDRRPLVLAGDSVGGLISLHLALRVLPGVFDRLVLIYPVLDLDASREAASYRTYGEGHFLDAHHMRQFRSLLQPYFAARDFDAMTLSPADLDRLPGCSVVTAGCDVLRDEGLAWAERTAARSPGLRHLHFPDLPHDFCLYAGRLDSARHAVARLARTAFPLKGEG
ncbi:alpha/beta hydrolase fold domain-containing protein [Streptomyces sp. NPDC090025]|uniref:alpha/beta hydrolase fold domain-containing protein n=1 Tax=Streptomyces sp. NPDC090025 TaxID=3365922 RepID=UPI0038361C34